MKEAARLTIEQALKETSPGNIMLNIHCRPLVVQRLDRDDNRLELVGRGHNGYYLCNGSIAAKGFRKKVPYIDCKESFPYENGLKDFTNACKVLACAEKTLAELQKKSETAYWEKQKNANEAARIKIEKLKEQGKFCKECEGRGSLIDYIYDDRSHDRHLSSITCFKCRGTGVSEPVYAENIDKTAYTIHHVVFDKNGAIIKTVFQDES